jgi:hypothetical protein
VAQQLFGPGRKAARPQWKLLPEGYGEQRRYPRMRISLAGQFMDKDRLEHEVMVLDLSGGGLSARTTAALAVGEPVIARIPLINHVAGVVTRMTEHGFAMRFDHGDAGAARIQRRLEALIADAERDSEGIRQEERITPLRKFVAITYEGQEQIVRVSDVSISGAAFESRAVPPIGATLRLGQREATIIRRTPTGAAVRFHTPIPAEDFGLTMTL